MTTPPEPDDRPGLPGALRVGGLLVLEAAIVVALHQLGRYPWMRVEWSNLRDWIEDSAPEDVLLGVLRTLALVLAWWLLATTLLYVVAGLSRVPYLVRSARWVTLPGVRRVVDGALAASITGGALLTGPPGSLGTPAPVVATDVADRPATAPVPAEAGLRMAIYRAAEPLADPPPGVRTYTVEAGDTLWEIAERELGDGHRWPEIFEANAQRTGGVMSEGPDVLRVGWTLVLPDTGDLARSPDTVGSGSAPTSSAGGVVVERGDDLWSLAAEQLRAQLGRSPSGDEVADYWRALIAANEGRLASGDPDLIFRGERLTVPPVGRSVGGTGDDPRVAAPSAPAGEVEEPSDTPGEAPERPAPAPAPAPAGS